MPQRTTGQKSARKTKKVPVRVPDDPRCADCNRRIAHKSLVVLRNGKGVVTAMLHTLPTPTRQT